MEEGRKRKEPEGLTERPFIKEESKPDSAELAKAEEDKKLRFNETLQLVTSIDYILGDFVCAICHKEMSKSVKVLCAECNIKLCIECLANGKENETHRRNHDYYILDRTLFPLFSPGWTAFEECQLIKGIERFGIDNWEEISEFMETKSSSECEAHYYAFYYQSKTQKFPTLDMIITERNLETGQQQIIQEKKEKAEKKLHRIEKNIRDKRTNTDENSGSSVVCSRLANPDARKSSKLKPSSGDTSSGDVVGYMPLRGDFTVEYDNDAELIISDMEFHDGETEIETKLKFEVLNLYNQKLDERIRRKKFIIDHDLVDTRKILEFEKQLSKEQKEVYSLLRPFMRFCRGDEFQRLVDSIIQERVLRFHLDELRHLQSLNLNTYEEIKKYLSKKELSRTPEPARLLDSASESGKPGISEASESPEAKFSENMEETKQISKEFTVEESRFCEENSVQISQYLALKVKLQEKAKKNRHFRRAAVLDCMDKQMPKETAIAIFNFLSEMKMLGTE